MRPRFPLRSECSVPCSMRAASIDGSRSRPAARHHDRLSGLAEGAQRRRHVSASQVLLRENLRVNESLFDNGKVTEDQVLRAKAELLAVDRSSAKPKTSRLRHRASSTSCSTATCSQGSSPLRRLRNVAIVESAAACGRTRCGRRRDRRVEQQRAAAAEQANVARKQKWPMLMLALDGGTQGIDYRAGEGYNFGTAALIFTWRLFDGGGDAAHSSSGTRDRASTGPAQERDRAADPARSSTGARPPHHRARLVDDRSCASRCMHARHFVSRAASATRASSARSNSSTRAVRSPAPS